MAESKTPLTPQQVADQQEPGPGRLGVITIKENYRAFGGRKIRSRTGNRIYYRFPPDAWERFHNAQEEDQVEDPPATTSTTRRRKRKPRTKGIPGKGATAKDFREFIRSR